MDGKVFDEKKAQGAIGDTLDLFAKRKLTVAESIHVLRCLTATFKVNHPEAFEIMWPDGKVD